MHIKSENQLNKVSAATLPKCMWNQNTKSMIIDICQQQQWGALQKQTWRLQLGANRCLNQWTSKMWTDCNNTCRGNRVLIINKNYTKS